MGNFNKMEVWQDSKELAVKIYKVTSHGEFARDYSFRDQIRRAAISIPSNLAEGEESIFGKVSIKHFSISSGSLAELRTQMEIARDIGYIGEEDYILLNRIMVVLNKRIKKLIQYRRNHL